MDSSKLKKLLSFIAAALTALCITTTAMPAAQAASVYDEYLSWSQLDERWSGTSMGETNIRSSGCLLTSLAIMCVNSDSIDAAAMKNLGISSIEEFDPGVLARAYTKANGFSSGGAIQSWGTIHQIVPNVVWGWDKNFTAKDKDGLIKEISGLMADGWHIIARVAAPYGGWHWVYIRSAGNGSIVMSDPAKEETDLYTAYPGGLAGEYWALKGSKTPAESGFPALYEAELNVEIQTGKTVYNIGEELDLSEWTVAMNGTDPRKGEWEQLPASVETVGNVTVDTSAYDMSLPGTYSLMLTADAGYMSEEKEIEVCVSMPAGVYFLEDSSSVPIYASHEEGASALSLRKGEVVTVSETFGSFGLIDSKDFVGWIDLGKLAPCAEEDEHIKGDINNDGMIDKYDLSLLNTYLKEKDVRPDGISTLTAAEFAAADINADGNVDMNDVIEFLSAIKG